MDRTGKVTIKGNPLTLSGNTLEVGQKAPDFTVLNSSLEPVSLSDFKGKVKVISATPSLDTPVCDAQIRRFNEEVAKLSDKVAVMNISVDLPFAIGRFCSTAGIDGVAALSDHRDLSFGENYGLILKELRLLGRAVVVVDEDDTVKYFELVPEVTDAPDFDGALGAIKELI